VSEVVDQLQRLSLFRGLAPDELARLVVLAPPVTFGLGEVVFQQGEAAATAMLVVSGRLTASVGTRTVGDIRAGEIVGETALFASGKSRSATVTAMESTVCLSLSRQLLAAAAQNPAMVALEEHLLGTLARRIRSTNLNIQKVWKEDDKLASTDKAATPSLRDKFMSLFGGGR
jgi:CRP-like cAMP-binding protein